MGSGESQPHRAIAFGFLRCRSQVVKVISAAKFELEMPKTVILRAMHDQIRAAGRRKQADLGFLSNSDVKKIPNAIALLNRTVSPGRKGNRDMSRIASWR